MANSDTEVVVIGGGAAGIAAGRRLAKAAIECLVVEARPRLGGRAWTFTTPAGDALDLGCGWLHSADHNPWVPIVQAQGRIIDKSPPPWERGAIAGNFSAADQADFRKAQASFFARVSAAAAKDHDVAASTALEPNGRWNKLIGAIGTYISGGELDQVSARDFDAYDGSGGNWRVREGYGTAIAAHGEGLSVVLDCPVLQIDHRGRRLKIETAKGVITADRAIVTLPTSILADKEFLFTPALPAKTESARGLPLGLADKFFMSLDGAEEFEPESRLFGNIDSSATATYHMRPFGRPLIEAYFGGNCARELEAGGERAFFDFAVRELTAQLGANFARRVKPLQIHPWAADPYARGSYSYAMPGRAGDRVTLAAPVDDRIFFAGEACCLDHFSTAHGAYLTGVAAAEQAIAARGRKRSV